MSAERRGWPAIRAMAEAEGSTSRRDGLAALGLFLFPVVLIATIGLAIGGNVEPVLWLGALDDARTPESRALIASLDADPDVRVRAYEDPRALRSAVHRGRLAAGLVLPPGWSPAGAPDLWLTAAAAGGPVLQTFVDARLAELRSDGAPAVGLTLSSLHDAEEEDLHVGFRYTAPANLVLFVLMGGLFGGVAVMVMRENGIARRLLATPASTAELYTALFTGRAQLLVFQCIFLIALTALAFGVPWGAPVGVLLAATSLVVLGASLSLLASTMYRTVEQAVSLTPLVGIGLGMLSGCMWPLDVVPAPLGTLGRLLPTAWVLDAFLELGFGGAPTTEVLPRVAAVFVVSAGVAALGLLRLRRQLAS